jgi:hypothetical protein
MSEENRMHLVLKQAGAVAAVFTLIGLGATAHAATASATPHAPEAVTAVHSGLMQRTVGAIKPLPGCAETFAPKVGSTMGRVCMKKLPATAAKTAPALFPCYVEYYQNGPYGSNAWSNGWGVCVQNAGNYIVPSAFNDQASAWDSRCPGDFYVNGPGTFPGSGFSGNSSGSFPWDAVPNDSLSSIQVLGNCQIT